MLTDLHLLLLVVQFVWSAVQEYSKTTIGSAELADIEAILLAHEQTPPANTPTGASASNSSLDAARAAILGRK